MNSASNFQPDPLDTEPTLEFFVDQLNANYCAKCHLVERFTEIADEHRFKELDHLISFAVEQAEHSANVCLKIYALLDIPYSFANKQGLVDSLELSFNNLLEHAAAPAAAKLWMMSYLKKIQSTIALSGQMMIFSARQLRVNNLASYLNGIDLHPIALLEYLWDNPN
jgi:hypothetical protein